MEKERKDTILVVTEDPQIIDLVANQALNAAGYQTVTANDASTAETKIHEIEPDLLLVDHDLSGVSAKDLLVILKSSGIDIPVIIMAKKGKEAEIIQSFRLGATDYLLFPVRETEVLSAVDRVLRQLHNQRKRARLEAQINQANEALQERVDQLTSMYSIGKTFTSTTDEAVLFEKVMDSAIEMTNANLGWFLLKDEATKDFILVAHRNLPKEMAKKLHQKWDDGISLLVAKTSKVLSMHGEAIKRFTISRLGMSILVVPILAQSNVIGLLVTMKKEAQPFKDSQQSLLEAIADYASIALDNARVFLAVEERMRALESTQKISQKIDPRMVQKVSREQRSSIEAILDSVERLANRPASHWATRSRRDLITLQEQVQQLIRLAEKSSNSH
ncbi:MAG: response regulator [Anaerolineaceae bacterium]|nr:response regulator [Anaerolineaceae bacterium]